MRSLFKITAPWLWEVKNVYETVIAWYRCHGNQNRHMNTNTLDWKYSYSKRHYVGYTDFQWLHVTCHLPFATCHFVTQPWSTDKMPPVSMTTQASGNDNTSDMWLTKWFCIIMYYYHKVNMRIGSMYTTCATYFEFSQVWKQSEQKEKKWRYPDV